MKLERPADSPAWYEAIARSFGLPTSELGSSLWVRSRTLSQHRYIATGAFATDGGDGALLDSGDWEERVLEHIQRSGAEFSILKTRAEPPEAMTSSKNDARYCSFLLDMTGGETAVWEHAVHAKTRNQTRKALKLGFEIRDGAGSALLDDFFLVVSHCWRDLGTPTLSREFYRQLLLAFAGDSYCKVLYLNGRPISAAMVIVTGNTIHHPFAATLQKFRSTCANNLLYWSIVQDGCQRELSYFDMGRSQYGQGTYRYKLSWGADVVPLNYLYTYRHGAPRIPPVSRAEVIGPKLWRHLPLWLSNSIGPLFIRSVL